MIPNASSDGEEGSPGLYANFPRRLNALSLDFLVLVGFSAVVFSLASFVERLTAVRVGLAIVWWAGLLLYEPLLVWRVGGTIGHRAMNLRVVDNRTRQSVSLPKAVTRYVVKALLGVFSFLTMSLTRRHQAVHDMVTTSSVRIRNPEKARPYQYTLGPP